MNIFGQQRRLGAMYNIGMHFLFFFFLGYKLKNQKTNKTKKNKKTTFDFEKIMVFSTPEFHTFLKIVSKLSFSKLTICFFNKAEKKRNLASASG